MDQLRVNEVQKFIARNSLSRIRRWIEDKLEEWKEEEITVAVTGEAGVGKSSFINAIRNIVDENTPGAAKTGVKTTTMEPTLYFHRDNNKIKFWDLPGIGTPDNDDHDDDDDEKSTMKRYIKRVKFEEYDTFLILAAQRFTNYDKQLAENVKSLNKPAFFVRTKIDVDVMSEERRLRNRFDEEEMLTRIRQNSFKHLEGLIKSNEDVFLISNYDTDKWDFDRLAQAILKELQPRKKECLILSLNLSTKGLIEQKSDALRARTWLVAAASGFGALVPVPGLSVAVDISLITRELSFYRSQLNLPEWGSDKFKGMTPEMQRKLVKYFISSVTEFGKLFSAYAASSTVEEGSRFIPIVGAVIAASISFTSTLAFLRTCLTEMEEIALAVADIRI